MEISKFDKYMKIILFMLIAIVFAGKATAITHSTLGPYEIGHRYYVNIYNVDDVSQVTVNGRVISTISYMQQSGIIDITDILTTGDNTIEFTTQNNQGGYAYGFKIMQDNALIWSDSCGKVGNFLTRVGCNNNDGTTGIVYDNVISLTVRNPNPILPIDVPVNEKRSPGFQFLVVILVFMLIFIKNKLKK